MFLMYGGDCIVLGVMMNKDIYILNEKYCYERTLSDSTASFISANLHSICPTCRTVHSPCRLIATFESHGRIVLRCQMRADLAVIKNENIRNVVTGNVVRTSDRYITYKIGHRMTFIKSQMGTGKTKALIDILIYASAVYDKVIFVSFRRSFTKEIARRLSHANFVSYMNVEGKITDARVIVQFESLCRIDMTPPEGAGSMYTLVILDEAKSIVGQAVLASQTRSMESQYGAFKGILVSARHILLMDAFLDDTTINLYSGIVNTKDIIIHVNDYDYSCQLIFLLRSCVHVCYLNITSENKKN